MKRSDILKLTLIPITIWVVLGAVGATASDWFGVSTSMDFTLLEGWTAAVAALGMIAMVFTHQQEENS